MALKSKEQIKRSVMPTASYRWGLMVTDLRRANDPMVYSLGFFKTERDAKTWAIHEKLPVFFIARRYGYGEALQTRGMP